MLRCGRACVVVTDRRRPTSSAHARTSRTRTCRSRRASGMTSPSRSTTTSSRISDSSLDCPETALAYPHDLQLEVEGPVLGTARVGHATSRPVSAQGHRSRPPALPRPSPVRGSSLLSTSDLGRGSSGTRSRCPCTASYGPSAGPGLANERGCSSPPERRPWHSGATRRTVRSP